MQRDISISINETTKWKWDIEYWVLILLALQFDKAIHIPTIGLGIDTDIYQSNRILRYDITKIIVRNWIEVSFVQGKLCNVWCIKFHSKHSTVLLLCLLRNLMHQTLYQWINNQFLGYVTGSIVQFNCCICTMGPKMGQKYFWRRILKVSKSRNKIVEPKLFRKTNLGIRTKGQLISECPFGVKTSSKKPTKFLPYFCPSL